jgi:putative oxidoreductase
MKLLSTKYSAGAFNAGMLILRVGLAVLMIPHGYDKLIQFSTYSKQFINFMGIGVNASLALTIFAELLCPFLVGIGFLTRVAAFFAAFNMTVAVIKGHNGEIFGQGEHAALYAIGFLAVMIMGPGRISVDAALGK